MVGRIDSFSFSILKRSCVLLFFIGILSTFFNLIVGLEWQISILTLSLSLVSLFCWWFLKFKNLFNFVRTFVSVWIFVLLNIAWYFNFSSVGPALGLYVIYVMLIAFIWPLKHTLFVVIIVLFNLGLLYYIELNYNDHILKYSAEYDRISDVYFGNVITLILTLSFSVYAKSKYESKYKEAKTSDKLKTVFLQNMSHELRTPLNAIIGFSGLMDDTDDAREMHKYARIINTSGGHLLNLVNELIDITMIESGQMKIIKEYVNFQVLIQESVDMFEIEKALSGKDIELKISFLEVDEDMITYTDPVRYKQILINLFKNALKFTQKGSIHIRFGLIVKDGHSMIVTSVEDTGIGIPKSMVATVFEAFSQVKPSELSIYEGMGIGLAISKNLCNLLGGDIWLESEEGKGSKFYFTISTSE